MAGTTKHPPVWRCEGCGGWIYKDQPCATCEILTKRSR